MSMEAANAISIGNQPFPNPKNLQMSDAHAKCVIFTHGHCLSVRLPLLLLAKYPILPLCLHCREGVAKLAGKQNLAAFDFSNGTLLLTEAGTKKRASLHLVQGEKALRAMDPGGIEVLECSLKSFAEALCRENHTLKRALVDPRLFSGVGNAYSDEILHAARLSPVTLTQRLPGESVERLHRAVQVTLARWIVLLRQESGDAFPEN